MSDTSETTSVIDAPAPAPRGPGRPRNPVPAPAPVEAPIAAEPVVTDWEKLRVAANAKGMESAPVGRIFRVIKGAFGPFHGPSGLDQFKQPLKDGAVFSERQFISITPIPKGEAAKAQIDPTTYHRDLLARAIDGEVIVEDSTMNPGEIPIHAGSLGINGRVVINPPREKVAFVAPTAGNQSLTDQVRLAPR